MAVTETKNDVKLIEAGFPCHQVGAETQRERDTGQAPPPNRLHVWWARRPLTPSRAAILASLLPAGTDPDWFLRQLGIEKVQALVNGEPWMLDRVLIDKIIEEENNEILPIDSYVISAYEKEQERRQNNRTLIADLKNNDPSLEHDQVLTRWNQENNALPDIYNCQNQYLVIVRSAADPYWAKERIEWENTRRIRTQEDKYGYTRAFYNAPCPIISTKEQLTILDPTSGGGSIPYEALRLGHRVIANELNPVATSILYATLDYPLRYGEGLISDIDKWGNKMRDSLLKEIKNLFPASLLTKPELEILKMHMKNHPDIIPKYEKEILDGFLYARQVTCPHCGGDAPLLNTCWLAKNGELWGVRIVPDGRKRDGRVRFEPYRLKGNRGPDGEDPNFATVDGGVGLCVHCRQAITSEEIKAQARGESENGRWRDRLYCVAAVRFQPKLDRQGQLQRYTSGPRAGEIKTEKIHFFRAPTEADLQALDDAEKLLQEKWPDWERQGLIPTENIPVGHKTMEPLRVGMNRWCDLFTPRQLLGHLFLIEELNRLKPEILNELGEERGRAVVTYLQFAIDKGLDYNSRQTLWHAARGVLAHTFTRHDFSLKWTFGEMVFSGPNSGAAWGLSQVIDAYKGMAELMAPTREKLNGCNPPVTILHGTAAHMDVPDNSVDLVCIDPPYYNNVQYAELSDYFYVWQRRTLQDLYPELYQRRLTNKTDEAVANPSRDGNAASAAKQYERLMGEIFAECRRVLKNDGIMTIMFTHKTQEAWEALTRSLIDNGWSISACMPVESEPQQDIHHKNIAAAVSSIFLTCRKRHQNTDAIATWTGFGNTGVAQQVRQAVREGLGEFERLHLNPVDEMVAAYGRALQVLSEHWPVLDGDEPVSPIRAMNEASAVVAQHQVTRLTRGRLQVDALNSEAAMALTLYGIFGLSEFSYDQALNISRSLGISLEGRAEGYRVEGRMIGVNSVVRGRVGRGNTPLGYHAPLLRRGSKLRLALPEERDRRCLDDPQSDWDIMQGTIIAFREGDVTAVRPYLARHAAVREQIVLDLLSVWAKEMPDEQLRKEGEAILFDLQKTGHGGDAAS